MADIPADKITHINYAFFAIDSSTGKVKMTDTWADIEKVFTGDKADAISDTISKNVPRLLPEHYMYLGRELQKAQECLEGNKKYVQDGC